MANLAAWIMALIGPVTKRVFALFGFGIITYAALVPLLNSVLSHAASRYGEIPSSIAQFLALVGAPEAFGIIGGAYVARLSFMALSHIGRVASS